MEKIGSGLAHSFNFKCKGISMPLSEASPQAFEKKVLFMERL
jgi:hypothetical protein